MVCTRHCFFILYFCIQIYQEQEESHIIANNILIPALTGCKLLPKFEGLEIPSLSKYSGWKLRVYTHSQMFEDKTQTCI